MAHVRSLTTVAAVCLALVALDPAANAAVPKGAKVPDATTSQTPEQLRAVAKRLRDVATKTAEQRRARIQKLAKRKIPLGAIRPTKTLSPRKPWADDDNHVLAAGIGSSAGDDVYFGLSGQWLVLYASVGAGRDLFVDCVVNTYDETAQFGIKVFPASHIAYDHYTNLDTQTQPDIYMSFGASDDQLSFVIPDKPEARKLAILIGRETSTAYPVVFTLHRCELNEVD